MHARIDRCVHACGLGEPHIPGAKLTADRHHLSSRLCDVIDEVLGTAESDSR